MEIWDEKDKAMIDRLAKNQEDLKEFLDGIVWESRQPKGGQHAGIDRGVILAHKDLGIRIEVFELRSQIENRRMALHLLYYFLDRLNYVIPRQHGKDTTTASSQDVPGGPES